MSLHYRGKKPFVQYFIHALLVNLLYINIYPVHL